MGKIWVKELTGGLDTRRMPVSTVGAVLMDATNGHITRGGEFEKRQAFKKAYSLPRGNTFGLSATLDGLYTFGTLVNPGTIPAGITYQRLVHPTNNTIGLARILDWDLNAGKLYVIALFENGDRFMYYDGVYVNSWSDGTAHATLTVNGDDITPGVGAIGSFRLTPGNSPGGSVVTHIQVDALDLMGGSVTYSSPFEDFVAAVVDAINLQTATTGYHAAQSGYTIKIRAPIGDDANGHSIDVTITGGSVTATRQQDFAGGADPIIPTLNKLFVGNRKLIDAPVPWTTTTVQMATDIAAAITAYSATSGFDATSDGGKVTVSATTQGDEPNGLVLNYVGVDGLILSDLGTMSGGSEDSLPRGVFTKTVDSKQYAVGGSVLYFSGINAPTKWTTDAVGAGFIDMASKTSGSERLQAIAKYQNYIAVFAEQSIIIEYVDPDPALNRLVQVLQQTGTIAPLTVTQFGDQDLYYLDKTGLRSLQARDASNAASTTDIGVMVDTLVQEKLRSLTDAQQSRAIGIIEPQEGRFWLILKEQVFVFSYFQGSRVSAWSTYITSTISGGTETVFETEYAASFDRQIYLRAGDTIYVYGGDPSTQIYDATLARARLPYLNANDPTRIKEWVGVDAAVSGTWQVAMSTDPNNQGFTEVVSNLTETTYDEDQLPAIGASTHISVELTTTSAEKAVVSSIVIIYKGDEIEDR